MSPQAEQQLGLRPDLITDAIAISSLIHWIGNRMTTTGTAAYSRFNLGFLDARIVYALAQTTPMRSAELAARLAVDRAAISRAVGRLTAQSLVYLGPKRRLLLTPQGKVLVPAVADVFEDRCLTLVADITDEERSTVLRLLGRLQWNARLVTTLTTEQAANSVEGLP